MPEGEILQGGDILVFGLPQQQCLKALEAGDCSVPSGAEADGFDSEVENDFSRQFSASSQLGDLQKVGSTLRLGDMELGELAGKKNVLAELVLSSANPFCGQILDGTRLNCFEDLYEIAVLSVRHVGENNDLPNTVVPRGMIPSDRGSASECRLWPGDTVMVLAQRASFKKLSGMRDFLAVTLVGEEEEVSIRWVDYLPLVLFLVGMALVIAGVASMGKVAVIGVVLYVLGGWVEPSRLSQYVDLHVLILIGSALGLAEAVTSSGLAANIAHCVDSMHLGPRGTVCVLFLFTMLLAETVTSAAAAALAFPLAIDLSNSLALASPRPLVMTVMLAAATSFANPVASPCCLIIMSRGNYTFPDFLKVGLPMDLIYWIGYTIFIPMVYSIQ